MLYLCSKHRQAHELTTSAQLGEPAPVVAPLLFVSIECSSSTSKICTGELGYDGPLYDGFLSMMDNMLGPSPMHIKYVSYVYDGF